MFRKLQRRIISIINEAFNGNFDEIKCAQDEIKCVQNEIKCVQKEEVAKLVKLEEEILKAREQINMLKAEQEQIVAKTLRGVECAIANSKLNEVTFAKYKNINRGKKVVICGAGPSLAKYCPITNAIHIALNRAFLFDKVKFDYVFAQDYRGIEHVKDELQAYVGNDCIKFFGKQNGSFDDEIPESYAIECNAERYATDGYIWLEGDKCRYAFEMYSKSVGNFATIALPALQFALWTNPEEIYIVGCDTSPNGHFVGNESEEVKKISTQSNYNRMINEWKEVASYAKLYYPGIKIYSINPVGLGGMFNDINYDSLSSEI